MKMEFASSGRLMIASLAICLIIGCSSGGGGHHGGPSAGQENGASSPGGSDTGGGDKQNSNGGQEATDNSATIPSSNATAGTAAVQTYISPEGTTYTLAGIAGTSMKMGADGSLSYASNGENGYARFGSWYSKTHAKTEYFYTGDNPTRAEQVPVEGSATYIGRAIRNNTTDGSSTTGGSTGANFSVDFSAKTISGSTEDRAGFAAVNMNGNIKGGGFSGSAKSGTSVGSFAGHFYGADAAELAGMASFESDATKNIAFGAVRQ